MYFYLKTENIHFIQKQIGVVRRKDSNTINVDEISLKKM